MYTIISSTNREGSMTLKIAYQYKNFFKEAGIEAGILSLEEINPLNPLEAIKDVEQQIFLPTSKFIFIVPEYHGSFPGVLKALIDVLPRMIWFGKKAALVGVAAGRAGNIRGIDHLTNILNYLGVVVLPKKVYLSQVEGLVNDEHEIIDVPAVEAIKAQIKGFNQF